VLGPDFSGSIEIIKSLLDGAMPALPRVYFGVVDVRDVADLHLRAMAAPEAKGERFIAAAGETLSILDIAKVLRRELGPGARRVPRLQSPDWLVWLAANGIPLLRAVVPMLGSVRHATGAKAKAMLGWQPRSTDEAILAAAESLIRLGLVRG
jgi:dihydroflavonol-4-reductase